MDGTSIMQNYDHDVSDVDTIEIVSIMKTNAEVTHSIEENINMEVIGLHTNKDKEDCSYLILKPNHFQIGVNSKGKSILQDVNFGVLIK